MSFTSTTLGIVVDLAAGQASGVEIGNDTLIGIENVVGGAGGDLLIGDSADNDLSGLNGNDTLSGGLGADTLRGGEGGDTFTGTLEEFNGDRIADFGVGDQIVLKGAFFDINRFQLSADGRATLSYNSS